MLINPFAALRALIASPPLEVGDVVEISNGLATIQLPGGGRIQARGQATVGDRVFVRAGAIEGPAPQLPIELIDV